MPRPSTLAGFKKWLKPGKKLLYLETPCTVTSVRSQTFDVTDNQGNVHRIPIVIGTNTFSGESFSLNGYQLQFQK